MRQAGFPVSAKPEKDSELIHDAVLLCNDLAEQRVEATTDLYAANRVAALDKLDAQDSLLSAQLNRNSAIVNYAIARLQFMNDLEAIRLSAQGLRFDLNLPMPASAE